MTSTLPTDVDGGGPRWLLEDAVLGQVEAEMSLTYDSLELTARASPPEGVGWGTGAWGSGPWGGEVGAEFWRQWDRAGDFELEDAFGGSWSAIATGTDDLRVTLKPPERFRPPFAVAEYMVDGVETVRESPEEVVVEVELVRTGPRENAFGDDVTVGEPHPDTHTGWGYSGWGTTPWSGYGTYSWQISMAHGNIELRDKFVGRPERASGVAGEEVAIELAVGDEQAAAIADSLGRVDGVVEHSVPGGDDLLRDATPDDNQTIELEPPIDIEDVDDLEQGTYFVRDWQIEPLGSHLSERPWRVELELTRRTD